MVTAKLWILVLLIGGVNSIALVKAEGGSPPQDSPEKNAPNKDDVKATQSLPDLNLYVLKTKTQSGDEDLWAKVGVILACTVLFCVLFWAAGVILYIICRARLLSQNFKCSGCSSLRSNDFRYFDTRELQSARTIDANRQPTNTDRIDNPVPKPAVNLPQRPNREPPRGFVPPPRVEMPAPRSCVAGPHFNENRHAFLTWESSDDDEDSSPDYSDMVNPSRWSNEANINDSSDALYTEATNLSKLRVTKNEEIYTPPFYAKTIQRPNPPMRSPEKVENTLRFHREDTKTYFLQMGQTPFQATRV